MAKYIRNLNKSDSKFYVSETPEIPTEYSLKETINECKKIRKDAFTNAQDMLKDSKNKYYGLPGQLGVMGDSGVMGQSGVSGYSETIKTDVATIKEIGLTEDYYIPIRGECDVKIEYDSEREIYSIGNNKYTAEALNDNKIRSAIIAENSPIPEINKYMPSREKILETEMYSQGKIPSGLTYNPTYAMSGSIDLKSESLNDTTHFMKTASCAGPIQHKENSYWTDKQSADRLKKLAGFEGKIINGKKVVRAVNQDKKEKLHPVGNTRQINNIIEAMKKAYEKRNDNWEQNDY